MPTHKLTWSGARRDLDRAGGFLTEVMYPPADAVSLTKLESSADDDETDWRLDAYFSSAPDMAKLSAALDKVVALSHPEIEVLPDIDWVAHALEGLGVVRVGRFVLYGGHDADKLPNEKNDVAIRIDANQAFGTGHHPTTAGCLALLDRLAGIAPDKVLDLGAGSAVLAIAAAKIWPSRIVASDIDETSVGIAKENAALNDVSGRISFVHADGFDHDDIENEAPFDFVFANILAGPLEALAPAMARHVARNGRVMLAGLMTTQEEQVRQAYEGAGFRLLNRLDDDTWPVFLFVRA